MGQNRSDLKIAAVLGSVWTCPEDGQDHIMWKLSTSLIVLLTLLMPSLCVIFSFDFFVCSFGDSFLKLTSSLVSAVNHTRNTQKKQP